MSEQKSAPLQGNLMKGKRGLVMGVANDRSIAWGIAAATAAQGAELACTYQGEALERRVRPLAESVGSSLIMECDVTNQDSMDETFSTLEQQWGKIDFILHGIAFSDKNELTGKYLDTSRDNFLKQWIFPFILLRQLHKKLHRLWLKVVAC